MSIVEKALNKLRHVEQFTTRIAAKPGGRGTALQIERAIAVPQGVVEPRTAARIELDHERLRQCGLEPPVDGDTGRLADEIRRVKWTLLNMVAGEGATAREPRTVIVISSALPGEGKSFTSFNLALSMATERDRRVWLIDADTVRPQLSRALGIEKRPGLLDVISDGDGMLEDVLVGTDVPGLFVIPSGRARPDAPELLGSARTAQLLASVQATYEDVAVVLDTAPILATSVPQALAPIASLIVIAVKADSTPRSAVIEAIAQLHRTDGIALVLNQVSRFMRQHHYDGYYDHAAKS